MGGVTTMEMDSRKLAKPVQQKPQGKSLEALSPMSHATQVEMSSRSTSAGSAGSASEGSTHEGSLSAKFEIGLSANAKDGVEAILKDFLVKQWCGDDFEDVKMLEEATANCGHVTLMRSVRRGGSFVAVKQMPNRWVLGGHAEFLKNRPKAAEQPWLDIGVTQYLHKEGFPFLCEPFGVFRGVSHTYVVSAFANRGDLFNCIKSLPCPGPAREAEILPLAKQVLEAVRLLHDLGIAHRDLSPENFVLMEDEQGHLQAKLIDFGMATFGRFSRGTCGKRTFVAPEMHTDPQYDAFLADAFSLGVVLFAMATTDYPWSSTRPSECKLCSYVLQYGLRSLCAKRRVIGDRTKRLDEVLSKPFMAVVDGLLNFNPGSRLTLGEACWAAEADATARRPSVLSSAWLQ